MSAKPIPTPVAHVPHLAPTPDRPETGDSPPALRSPLALSTRRYPRTLEQAFGPYAWGRPSVRLKPRLLPWTGVVLRLLGIGLGLTVLAHLITQAF